jgi:hypothetical protein
MSDINLHDDSPHQDWQGGPKQAWQAELDAIMQRHIQKALHDDEPVTFSAHELEHIFEQARAALHKEGMNWAEASRLAERIRVRCMGLA